MSTVKKCDRCGKLYDCNIKYSKGYFSNYRVEKGLKLFDTKDREETYELCDECLTALHLFLDNVVKEKTSDKTTNNSVIRSFYVEPISVNEINSIDEKLDDMLHNLQSSNWEIISVTPIEFELWVCPNHHKAVKFIIIAKHDILKEEEM